MQAALAGGGPRAAPHRRLAIAATLSASSPTRRPPRLWPLRPSLRRHPGSTRAAPPAAAADDPSPAAADIPDSLDAAVAVAAGAWAAALGGGATGRLLGSSSGGGGRAPPTPTRAATASPRGKKKQPPKKAGGGGFASKTGVGPPPAAPPAGFRGGPPARATLEVPAADTSPAGLAALAVALAAALPLRPPAGLTLVFGDVDAALAASDAVRGPGVAVTALEDDGDGGGDGDAEGAAGPPGSALLVVAPSSAQAAALGALLAKGGPAAGRDVALLNPGWAEGGGGGGGPPPPPLDAAGFVPAYAFIPIAISSFMGLPGEQGAVVYRPGGPWRIYKAAGGGRGAPAWSLVGRSDGRPTARDLEDAFYNAAAASSPLTKGAAALKGLADKVRGKQ